MVIRIRRPVPAAIDGPSIHDRSIGVPSVGEELRAGSQELRCLRTVIVCPVEHNHGPRDVIDAVAVLAPRLIAIAVFEDPDFVGYC
jgi:hypothetical protein